LGHNYSGVIFSPERNMFVATYSSASTLPRTSLFIIGANGRWHQHLLISGQSPATPLSETLCIPKVFHFLIEGKSPRASEVLFGALYESPRGKAAPTVVYVYGGPQVQLVINDFKLTASSRAQMLVALGYNVVSIDGRGTPGRGRAFETAVYRNLGSLEVSDQVEGLKYLQEQGLIDMSRGIAITGWSYGGYVALLALAHHPEIFRLCIAGAPVTDWELYDTGYTERYMDLPAHNPEGYSGSSVLNAVTDLPDDEDRLLLAHGLIDENVHFHHTAALVDALVVGQKPYHLKVFPRERHGLRSLESALYFELTAASFLERYLS